MYKVIIDKECSCFKKSEYKREETFQYQQEAYNYTNLIVELMNEEFCQKHLFFAEKSTDNEYLIKVVENTTPVGSCSTGGCGPCGC